MTVRRRKSFGATMCLLLGCTGALGVPEDPPIAEETGRLLQLCAERSEDQVTDAVIQLSRTVCFGVCPSYTVEVGVDGAVAFEGDEYVEARGLRCDSIEAEHVGKLVEAALRLGFMELTQAEVDECSGWWTDHPSVITTVNVDGRKKTIDYYLGCKNQVGKRLIQLADRIDLVLETARWVGPPDSHWKTWLEDP